ncbi:STAS-like domain-containing protein [Bradyrhizobium sp. NBAIM01]|uniref:STAS-like domain-containing protein n=1 Tax=Bradyrhizobium sp. NBAIM01 TaxID=2793818 RepID=UPI001CD80B25|nr:STAS-like domain-containing protein [Bradyrhizobium sp. NBAIM01]MCA1510249.1 STAS-like domain-containing protein [Bradyrhizobium sp. NBAIM01]
MSERRISLAKDFSRHVGPRYIKQGPFSGEKFRKVLVDALAKNDVVVIDLDGTTGIGSSFLDEAFGGLVFAEGMAKADVQQRVRVKSDLDESYLMIVREAIELAEPNSASSMLAVAHAH